MRSRAKYPKIGETVTILDPRPIERVGYENCVETVITEVEKDPEVLSFISSQWLIQSSADRVIRTVAVSRVHDRMKSGAERKIFYAAAQEISRNSSYKITDKKICQIGIYYPSSGGCVGGYYGEEYDYEPGGLDNRKTVMCFRLDGISYLFQRSHLATQWNDGFWFTSDQVTWEGKQ